MCAPIPSEERVEGSIPRHIMDKRARFHLAVLNSLSSLGDPEVAIGNSTGGVTSARSIDLAKKQERTGLFLASACCKPEILMPSLCMACLLEVSPQELEPEEVGPLLLVNFWGI